MDISRFVQIPEYCGYFISPEGEVYSTKSNRLLKIFTNTSGYRYITVRKDNKSKNLLLHRVLAAQFLGLDLLCDLEVDHKDCDKLNNSLGNLQILTKPEHIIKTIEERGLRVRQQEYCSCGTIKTFGAKVCSSCQSKPIVSETIEQAQIEYWVTKFSWVRAQKELGMSDTGLKKRYRQLTGKDPKCLTKHNLMLS